MLFIKTKPTDFAVSFGDRRPGNGLRTRTWHGPRFAHSLEAVSPLSLSKLDRWSCGYTIRTCICSSMKHGTRMGCMDSIASLVSALASSSSKKAC